MSKPNRVYIVETRTDNYDWSPEPTAWWSHWEAHQRRRDVIAEGVHKSNVRVTPYVAAPKRSTG